MVGGWLVCCQLPQAWLIFVQLIGNMYLSVLGKQHKGRTFV